MWPALNIIPLNSQNSDMDLWWIYDHHWQHINTLTVSVEENMSKQIKHISLQVERNELNWWPEYYHGSLLLIHNWSHVNLNVNHSFDGVFLLGRKKQKSSVLQSHKWKCQPFSLKLQLIFKVALTADKLTSSSESSPVSLLYAEDTSWNF